MTSDGPDQMTLSLEQIEQAFWGDAPGDATKLIRIAHELRRKPVHDLTAEDLRLLLSQQIGVEVLAPRTISLLRQDPLAEGDYYPGDLLVAMLKLPTSYWDTHPGHLKALREIAQSIEDPDDELQGDIRNFLTRTAHPT